MAYGVHGDEISSGDAALLTAYHLLADRRAATREMLEKVVVILDPMQNPDGRDRFVNFHRAGRGVAPDPEPLAAERVQGWAAGRHNHYLFDMNRDWFLQTQVETRTRDRRHSTAGSPTSRSTRTRWAPIASITSTRPPTPFST